MSNDAATQQPASPPMPRSDPRSPGPRFPLAAVSLVVGSILIVVALWMLTHSNTGPRENATSPSSNPSSVSVTSTFSPSPGPSLQARVLPGVSLQLNAPTSAAPLPDGGIAIADTGNHRLVIVPRRGSPLSIKQSTLSASTSLIAPYAVAVHGSTVYVLDSGLGMIGAYAVSGRPIGTVIGALSDLTNARDMAVGPDGTLYVANPATNAVLTISPHGHIVHTLGGQPIGAGPDQFNQPSGIAVGSDGTLYILDNVNNRIKVLSPSGALRHLWPTAISDTLHSVHVLPLPDGRLLASDPSGALIVYAKDGSAVRFPLTALASRTGPNVSSVPIKPLGLALLSPSTILVTDNSGNRLLLVPLPSGKSARS